MTAIEIRQPYPDQELTFQDTWHLLVRNRGLIIGCTTLVVAASAIWAYTATPVYEASTSIRIDEEKSRIPVLEALQQLSSGSDLVTEMEVLKSRSLAENVVDSLALRAVLTRPSRVDRSRVFSLLKVAPNAPSGGLDFTRKSDGSFSILSRRNGQALGSAIPGQQIVADGVTFVLRPGSEFKAVSLSVVPLQSAVSYLRKRTSVSRPSRTANVVVVRHEGTDPSLVREVPNVLADRFILHRREVQTTEARSVARFLRQQLDTLSLQLTAAENTLQNFRQQAQVVNLPAEGTAQVTRLASLQGERSSINAERVALSALLTEIRSAAAQQKPDDPSPYRRMLAFPTLFKNTSTNETLRALTDLEDQRAALLVRRTPKDPDVIALTSRIKELEQQLQSVGETYLQGLTNQVAALDGSLAQFGAQLEKIPAKEVEFARLERRPKILEEIYTLLQTRLKEAEITEAAEDPTVRVVDAAILPISPVRPKRSLVISMAALLGLLLSVGAAFAREMMDRTVHTKEDVQAFTGTTVLGLIPRIPRAASELRGPTVAVNRLLRRPTPTVLTRVSNSGQSLSAGQEWLSERLVTGADPRSPVSEAYRSLRTNITFARPDQVSKTLVFTSPMPGDGKTTSAANLAITLAQQGVRILLIDGDLRRGVLNGVFGTQREPGLSNVLLGVGKLEQAVRSIDLGQNGSLDFLSSGTLPPNPAELLGSHRMRNLLAELEDKYDAIIIDSPPLNIVTDAAVLGTVADGVVMVARAGITEKAGLRYAAEQLANVHAPLLGAVLNDVDFESNRYYGMYGKYGYYQYNYRYQAQESSQSDIPVPFLKKT